MGVSAQYDVIVIGGGASGLAAALSAARSGAKVAVLERDVACGIKLLATGNGRCNLSNRTLSGERYTHPGFVTAAMGPAPEEELERFFASVGICTVEEDGRLYPYSRRAESVRDALLDACCRYGIDLVCSADIKRASHSGSSWELVVEHPSRALRVKPQRDRKAHFRALRKAAAESIRTDATYRSGSIVLATGGNSADIANLLDLPFTPCRPVLCPVQGRIPGCAHALRDLNGQRVQCRLSLHRDRQAIWSEEGEILFRPYGISGVVAFNLSRRIEQDDIVSLDLFPHMETEELLDLLKQREAIMGPFSTLDPSWFDGLLAPALARTICGIYETNHSRESVVAHLATICKHLKLIVEGTADEASAQVMRGGIPVSSISSTTLAHNGTPRLFMCGEALDVDADCGGFNLAWAWLSGLHAGRAAANERIATEGRS